MVRKKDNDWHIVGINAKNTLKEIYLYFVSNASGIVIVEKEEGFQQLLISKRDALKVSLKPYGGFVVKI